MSYETGYFLGKTIRTPDNYYEIEEITHDYGHFAVLAGATNIFLNQIRNLIPIFQPVAKSVPIW